MLQTLNPFYSLSSKSTEPTKMEMQSLPIHSVDAAASLDSAPVLENNDVAKIEQLENKRKKTSIFTTIIISIIAISIVFQLLSISTNYDSGIVILSTLLGFTISVTAGYKQVILLRLDTLRTVHNKIRMEVNRFMEENNKLTRNVDGLEDQVLRLQDLQEDLERVAQAQGCTANELVSLVEENASTLKQQKVNIYIYVFFCLNFFNVCVYIGVFLSSVFSFNYISVYIYIYFISYHIIGISKG